MTMLSSFFSLKPDALELQELPVLWNQLQSTFANLNYLRHRITEYRFTPGAETREKIRQELRSTRQFLLQLKQAVRAFEVALARLAVNPSATPIQRDAITYILTLLLQYRAALADLLTAIRELRSRNSELMEATSDERRARLEADLEVGLFLGSPSAPSSRNVRRGRSLKEMQQHLEWCSGVHHLMLEVIERGLSDVQAWPCVEALRRNPELKKVQWVNAPTSKEMPVQVLLKLADRMGCSPQ